MRKFLAVVLLVMFLMPVVTPQVFAAEEKTQTGVTDVGNKLCPVSGDPVSGTHFVTYQGKRYGLCCPMCQAPFLSNPAKYIAQMEAKEKKSAPAIASASDVAASKEMEKDMEQGSL
jgi:YHS domain-containing protein